MAIVALATNAHSLSNKVAIGKTRPQPVSDQIIQLKVRGGDSGDSTVPLPIHWQLGYILI